jgi:hypothetical protein
MATAPTLLATDANIMEDLLLRYKDLFTTPADLPT